MYSLTLSLQFSVIAIYSVRDSREVVRAAFLRGLGSPM